MSKSRTYARGTSGLFLSLCAALACLALSFVWPGHKTDAKR